MEDNNTSQSNKMEFSYARWYLGVVRTEQLRNDNGEAERDKKEEDSTINNTRSFYDTTPIEYTRWYLNWVVPK